MKLLERKPTKRLGMLSGKAADVMRHKWFDGVDWDALGSKRVVPPRKPRVRDGRGLGWKGRVAGSVGGGKGQEWAAVRVLRGCAQAPI
jgi:hypothetical protein